MWKELSYLLGTVLLAVLSGCGGGRPDGVPPLVPASGTVTLDGKPLPDAEISIEPVGEEIGSSSFAYSDNEGKFTLRTSSFDGAVVGEYKVTVVRYGNEDGTPLSSEERATEFPPIEINILPTQYENKEQTPLKITIGEEGNESISLELVSK